MKICVPGLAVKMMDCSEKNSSGGDRGKSLLEAPSWLAHCHRRITDHFPAKGRGAALYFWDHHRKENGIISPLREFRDHNGIRLSPTKRHIIGRPSTAVRRHVKKITEEFTITQTKYENGARSNGIVIHIEPSPGEYDGPIHTGALNSIFSPKSQSKKFTFRKVTTCSKCGPSLSKVIPVVTAPPLISNTNSANPKVRGRFLSPRVQNILPKRNSFYLSQSSSPLVGSCSRHRGGGQGEHLTICRVHRRKKSYSANAGFYGGVLKVPFEQVKKAKLVAENALREGKVFAIHGVFPAIREALVKRGWVEKNLHSIPYVNPHPQNCVCVHVGWHLVSSVPSHSSNSTHHHNCSQSCTSLPSTASDTSSTISCSTANCETTTTANQSYQCNLTAESVILDNENNNCQTNKCNFEDRECDCHEEESESVFSGEDMRVALLENEEYLEKEEDSCIIECCEEETTTIQNNIAKCEDEEETEYNEEENVNNEDDEESEEIILENQEKEMRKEEGEHGDNEEDILNVRPPCNSDIETEEYIKKMTKTINTAFLGPSEIRKGLYKSINKKNLSIFQYSVPPYERKRKSTFTKPDSDKKSSKTDEEIDYEVIGLDEVSPEINENILQPNEDDDEILIEEEPQKQPYNPYPKLDYILTDIDKPVVARVLRNMEPNFIWSWNRDSISFKHLSKEQWVNRFPNTPFTTKYGLCETLQQLHWFSEAASVDSFVPRGYCIGHEDERTAFIHDYRTTACLNMLKWITERAVREGPQAVAHPLGEVPVRRIRQALQHVERFIQACCHDDLDSPPLSPLRETEWDALFNAHHRIIHQGRRVKAPQHHIESLLRDCKSALARVKPYWPQLEMDGVRNVWIVKPGAQSRGRGIFLLNQLEEILALVHSPLIYQTKYVVQKYMERPLLIHNTKFDIRQWFIVTDWNPLTVWMYKESYLRFCSQQYDLTNCAEAIHLSNNAIQSKYHNGERDEELPEENMWDCQQFKDFLRSQGQEEVYDNIIYPGMRDALTATMLAAQVEMDSFKHGFEFFGADFMLTEDFRPWLIEINSSPCMAPTTSVTRRMCNECLHDVIKVAVDFRQCKSAVTGKFEMIYQDKEKSIVNMPYVGVSLQITGRQLWRHPKHDRRRLRKVKPLPKVLKALPLVTLQLEMSGNVVPSEGEQRHSASGPSLMTVITPPPLVKISETSEDPNDQDGNKNECRDTEMIKPQPYSY